ncbi:hypothetical protein B7P43_G15834 [Cryptotermes secundus]|uniref:Uncharacterized protein n=1 Tax=Cryptotermes secundus TaxID=105785 RepID=A0A2J7R9D8_9NEOP|nr:hypothetical protein B7P43_G15834 [Cryptotermes secundus]
MATTVGTSNSISGSEYRHERDQADGERVGAKESGHLAGEVFYMTGLGHTSRANRIVGRQPRQDSI